MMVQTEFEFTLPKGYLDENGNLHRIGIMRLARAMDEIVPMRDPRVKLNPAYSTVIILARVIVQLGALEEITPTIVENLFACDLNYLYQFYRQINQLETDRSSAEATTAAAGSSNLEVNPIEMAEPRLESVQEFGAEPQLEPGLIPVSAPE